jgi:Holliday junction DNA helicase RuvB
MSKRSRGTPRVALRLLKRVRDFSQVKGEKTILLNTCKYALDELGINENGFDEMDINLLELLISNRGRPMGLGTMAAALSEDEGTIEDAIEPYLLANGYIERTARGRVASVKTYEMFRLTPPQNKLDDNNPRKAILKPAYFLMLLAFVLFYFIIELFDPFLKSIFSSSFAYYCYKLNVFKNK